MCPSKVREPILNEDDARPASDKRCERPNEGGDTTGMGDQKVNVVRIENTTAKFVFGASAGSM